MKRPLLVVEDNPQDEFFILRALATLGEVPREVARDGEQALQRLFDLESPLPCAVILDIMLPRVNGLEVLKRLRAEARTKRLPIIMLSSSAEPADLAASYEWGANAYVQKSSDFAVFERNVRNLATFWTQSNTPPP